MSRRPWSGRARRNLVGRIGVTVIWVALVAAGCGVSDSGRPERVDVGLGLDDPATTTTTTTTTTTITPPTPIPTVTSTPAESSNVPTSLVATENVPLFFLSSGQLTSISIPLTSPATLGQVMVALQSGPLALGPPGRGLRTAIPLDLPPIQVTDTGDGTAAVDLPPRFFDGILPFEQRLAVAQIVLTLTNQRGIGSVRFTRAGAPTSVILGNGEQNEPGRTVSKADYRSLVVGSDTTSSTTSSTGPSTTGSSTGPPVTPAAPAGAEERPPGQ